MGDPMDYYDVEAMIRDARSEIRGEIDNAVREARQALWVDVKSEIQDLRDEIRQLREDAASAVISGGTLG